MNVLVVGAAGGLGTVICQHMRAETDWSIAAVTRDRYIVGDTVYAFSTSDKSAWNELLREPSTRPDVIVNAAALTNVDRCERERERAWGDNVDLVVRLVDVCRRHDVRFIQLSTDYVFDGKQGPYAEGATPHPINYYGKTKLAAENECRRYPIRLALVRTMWLYGGKGGRTAFVDWLANELAAGRTVAIAQDEIGNPTLCDDVAQGIRRIIEMDVEGVFNIAGPEILSRLDVAYIVANWVGADPQLIQPVLSSDLRRAALRPLHSGLLTLRAQAILGLRGTPLHQGLQLIDIRRSREEMGW